MRFEYLVHLHKASGLERDTTDYITVSITFVKPSKGYNADVGSLIFNDPDEFREQYELWKVSMQWTPLHVLVKDIE